MRLIDMEKLQRSAGDEANMASRRIGGLTMIDREKVIKGLACCIKLNGGTMRRSCESCPYNDNREEGTCISIIPLLEDARSLLLADQANLADLRKRLETIADIAFDYDGYKTEEDLKALIDELRDIALRGVPEEVTDDAE